MMAHQTSVAGAARPVVRSLMTWMLACVALYALAGPSSALAQGAYPVKPVRVVVGFPPGTPPEIFGRLIAEKLTASVGQPFVIENRPGAGGTIAATAITQAAPDGYTIMVGVAASLAVAPHFLPSARYDPRTAFTPIGLIQRGPYYYVVRSDLPVKSVSELIAYAKQNPGRLNFATPGIGTPHHLNLELLKMRHGLNIAHVPFQGSPPMVNETVAGRTQLFMDSGAATVVAQIKSGTLRMIGMTGAQRSSLQPAVATVGEQGLPEMESHFWWGLVGPAGLPREIVTRLNAELNKALASPDMRERFRAEGIPDELQRASTPDEFARTIAAEFERWGPIVKAAGVKVE